jgi:hypothetical protein
MNSEFMSLAAWARPVEPPHISEPDPIAAPVVQTDELCIRVRLLRAAVLEALDDPKRASFDRVRTYADTLLEEFTT